MKSITLTEARNNLLAIAEQIRRAPETVLEVVKRGRPVMVLMSAELYDSLVETLDILGDESTARKLRRALRGIAAGKTLAWDEAKRRLGIGG